MALWLRLGLSITCRWVAIRFEVQASFDRSNLVLRQLDRFLAVQLVTGELVGLMRDQGELAHLLDGPPVHSLQVSAFPNDIFMGL